MLKWLKTGWQLAKSIPEALRLAMQLKDMQIQAKDATIEAREAQLDSLDERLLLRDEKAAWDAQLHSREIAQLRVQLEQMGVEKQGLAAALLQILGAMSEVAEKTARFAQVESRLGLAWDLNAYYFTRVKESRGIGSLLDFAKDVLLATTHEIRVNCEQNLEFIKTVNIPTLNERAAHYETMLQWATEREALLSRTHTLPEAPGSETPT